MTRSTAKLFMHGRSQAVRLPKEFRMEGTEVEISKSGNSIKLTPIKNQKSDWSTVFDKMDALGPKDDYPEGWRQQNLLPLKPKVSSN